jgi:hypothetical protein
MDRPSERTRTLAAGAVGGLSTRAMAAGVTLSMGTMEQQRRTPMATGAPPLSETTTTTGGRRRHQVLERGDPSLARATNSSKAGVTGITAGSRMIRMEEEEGTRVGRARMHSVAGTNDAVPICEGAATGLIVAILMT